jgi:hypothetical protein
MRIESGLKWLKILSTADTVLYGSVESSGSANKIISYVGSINCIVY